MAEFNANEIKAPVYRYFTVDLMTNKVLMEIPFQGVSYERALKAAGAFAGKIPVNEKTRSLSLYENTMPGQTGLYVVRNGKAVWGGIIWARDYSVKDKVLSVSASEFTSYFHHRLIWKTLNFQYGATVSVSDPIAGTPVVTVNGASNPTAYNNLMNWDLTASSPGTKATFVSATANDSNVPGYNTSTSLAGYTRLTYGASSSQMAGIAYTDGINPGGQYNVSIYARISSGTNKLQLRLTWLDSTSAQVGSYISAPVSDISTSWRQYTYSGAVAPQGATSLRVEVYPGATGTTPASGLNLYATAVRYAPTTDGTDYAFFNGDTADNSFTDYYTWEGEPNLSSSAHTVIVAGDGTSESVTTVTFDSGNAKEIAVGASVGLEFYEPENFRYNGNYEVTRRDSPSSSTFEINTAVFADITRISRGNYLNNTFNQDIFVTTAAPHGFSNGDTVTISGLTGNDAQFNGVYSISLLYDRNTAVTFRALQPLKSLVPANGRPNEVVSSPIADHPTSGTVGRFLPAGVTFENVTLTVHTDTYDYIRGLVENVWDDFVDIKFANDYLTPGVERQLAITQTQISSGYAQITTAEPHGLVVGQTVEISELNSIFNGTWTVDGVPSDTTFTYRNGGYQGSTKYTVVNVPITSRYVVNGVATITTNSRVAAGYQPGDVIIVDPMEDYDGLAAEFVGSKTIENVSPAGAISFGTSSSNLNSSPRDIVIPEAARYMELPVAGSSDTTKNTNYYPYSFGRIDGYDLTNGILTCHFVSPLYSDRTDVLKRYPVVGDRANVRVPFTRTIVEKSIDAPNSTKAIVTKEPHNLDVGDTLYVYGDRDVYDITKIEYSGATARLTTSKPHNIKVNQGIRTNNITERYNNVRLNRIFKRTLTMTDPSSGAVTFTKDCWFVNVQINDGKHNVPYSGWNGQAGSATKAPLSFENYYSYFAVSSLSVKNKIATIKTSKPHTFFANEKITLSGLSESESVISAEVRDGIVILTTDRPHNMQVADQITVTGVGAPFNTNPKLASVVLSTTDTRILFALQDATGKPRPTANVAPRAVSGTVSTSNSTFNGTFTVNTVPNANTLTVSINANDDSRSFSGGKVQVGGQSILQYVVGDQGITYVGYETYTSVNINPDRSLDIPLVTPDPASTPSISGGISLSGSKDTTVLRPYFETASIANYTNVKVTQVTSNTISFSGIFSKQNLNPYKDNRPLISKFSNTTVSTGGGQTSVGSDVNGYFFVHRVVDPYRVESTYDYRDINSGPRQSILETVTSSTAFFRMNSDILVPKDSELKYIKGTANAELGPAYLRGPSSGVSSGGAWENTSTAYPALDSKGVRVNTMDDITSAVIVGYSYDRNTISFRLDRAKKFGSFTYSGIINAQSLGDSLDTTYVAVYNQFGALKNNTLEIYKRTGGRYHSDVPYTPVISNTPAIRRVPKVRATTYGSFPGNTNLGMKFSTSQYSGTNVTPTAYRGHALTNVGEALDAYSGTTNGFEYRIDVDYDEASDVFTRTFVLIPINFPDPPEPGQVSDPSRFGADKLVFEYPGSITEVKLEESAENSATRFFAVGDANLGADSADPYSAASNLDLLNDNSDRRWPILDDKESIADVSDKDILYTYAKQYLNEARPPAAEFTIPVNGSLQPPLETFLPGSWCSIIVNDEFIQDRLKSRMEPRDTVLVRKIDSYKVNVPDGVTFPETVDLTLVTEWDIDKKADGS